MADNKDNRGLEFRPHAFFRSIDLSEREEAIAAREAKKQAAAV